MVISGILRRRTATSPAGHGPDDPQRLRAIGDRFGQRRIRRLERQVLSASEEANHRAAAQCCVVPDRPPQDRVARFERVEHGAERGRVDRLELNFPSRPGEIPEVVRERDTNHERVCTSTDNTAGRSRTIAFQLSPPSGEQ